MKERILLVTGFIFAAIYRLVPFRPPNVEPLLSVMMPFSKKISALEMAFFGFLSIFLHDLLTAGIGGYTWTTGGMYAVLGLFSHLYFAKKPFSRTSYVSFSVISIIFYDFMTGIVLGPMISGGSIAVAFVGQIPFTAMHLMGGVLFTLILSPLIEKALARVSVPVSQYGLEVAKSKIRA